jgi:hypothetical protein
MSCKPFIATACSAAALLVASLAQAANLVNDTWQDAERASPASPTYSEIGVDGDTDGDLESAWFNGGASTMTVSQGHLNKDLTGSSANWTTYFTPEGSEVNLANSGDKLRVTWSFSLTGVGATNTSQNFRIGLVDSIPANRLSADGVPPSGTSLTPYTGYAIFANMGVSPLGNSSPFQIRERVAQTGTNSILGTSGDWSASALTGTTNGATAGNNGFEAGVAYTLVWELTRSGAGIDIDATLSGGTYNSAGTGVIDANDADGNGFIFDTFNVRPSSAAGTAEAFDTTLFRVEFIPIPEPAASSIALIGAAIAAQRKRRS